MRHSKVAVIGAGAVGSTTAYALMLRNIVAEIMLVDIDKERCKGEVFDLSDALSFSDTSQIRATTTDEAKTADIIIITAGVAQKKGQTRAELVEINKKNCHFYNWGFKTSQERRYCHHRNQSC
ncbi:hypothetical protein ACFLX2_00800 [Candidatus Dependentiae bacterium]